MTAFSQCSKYYDEKMKKLRHYGFEEPRLLHGNLGFNHRFSNLHAAVGVA